MNDGYRWEDRIKYQYTTNSKDMNNIELLSVLFHGLLKTSEEEENVNMCKRNSIDNVSRNTIQKSYRQNLSN